MESVAPPLKCLMIVRASLENGEPLIVGVRRYIQNYQDEFVPTVSKWLFAFEQGQDLNSILNDIPGLHRRVLLEVFTQGLQGNPVHTRLCELEEEMVHACRQEIERTLTVLPIKMLIPLLLIQFPAFLLLLFGPLLNQLLRNLSQ